MARQEEEKKTFGDKLSEFVLLHKKVILITTAVIIAAILTIGLVSYISERNYQQAVVELERAERSYDELASMDEDSEEYREQAEDVESRLQAVIDGRARKYPHMKASYLLGMLRGKQGDYQEAAELFESVASEYPESHLAPSAVSSHAAALEMLEDYDGAIDRYQYVIDTYADVSAEGSHAYFSIGRLYELTDRTELAVAAYEQLEAEYPQSEWTKLANSRLIRIQQ